MVRPPLAARLYFPFQRYGRRFISRASVLRTAATAGQSTWLDYLKLRHKSKISFWKELILVCGVQLHMSTAKNPQKDGALYLMNGMVEHYLLCFSFFHQDDWEELLACS